MAAASFAGLSTIISQLSTFFSTTASGSLYRLVRPLAMPSHRFIPVIFNNKSETTAETNHAAMRVHAGK